MIVDDFKVDGLWKKSGTRVNDKRSYTRAAKFYWGMMARCVDGGSQQLKRPRYKGVTCEFESFQDFAEWCQTQIGYLEQGFQLDKDLLSGTAKRYSRDTCVFIPAELNTLTIKREAGRGEFPVGVCRAEDSFMAQCSVGEQKQKYLGVYATPELAFEAYKVFKESFIKQQANKWRDKIDPRAYDALMNYQVEITD